MDTRRCELLLLGKLQSASKLASFIGLITAWLCSNSHSHYPPIYALSAYWQVGGQQLDRDLVCEVPRGNRMIKEQPWDSS